MDSFVDHDGYSISSKGFLPAVVDIMVELNSPIPAHFSSLIPRMLTFTLAISFDHFQFALIHGPNIPGKDSDAGRDWGQEEKGTTQDEMAGWYHGLDGRESE